MKKIWIVLWLMVISFSLTACGEDNGQAGASISAPETVGTESMPQPAIHQETESANAQEAQSADTNATESVAEDIQERSVSDSTGNTAESAADIRESKPVQETEMNEAGGMETDIQNDGEENAVVSALVEMMRESPVVLQMSDYSGFEKVGPLGTSLPADNSQTTTHAGDIVLYNGNQIVIFYGSNSWSYTRLGHIDDLVRGPWKRGCDGDIFFGIIQEAISGGSSVVQNRLCPLKIMYIFYASLETFDISFDPVSFSAVGVLLVSCSEFSFGASVGLEISKLMVVSIPPILIVITSTLEPSGLTMISVFDSDSCLSFCFDSSSDTSSSSCSNNGFFDLSAL